MLKLLNFSLCISRECYNGSWKALMQLVHCAPEPASKSESLGLAGKAVSGPVAHSGAPVVPQTMVPKAEQRVHDAASPSRRGPSPVPLSVEETLQPSRPAGPASPVSPSRASYVGFTPEPAIRMMVGPIPTRASYFESMHVFDVRLRTRLEALMREEEGGEGESGSDRGKVAPGRSPSPSPQHAGRLRGQVVTLQRALPAHSPRPATAHVRQEGSPSIRSPSLVPLSVEANVRYRQSPSLIPQWERGAVLYNDVPADVHALQTAHVQQLRLDPYPPRERFLALRPTVSEFSPAPSSAHCKNRVL